MMNCFAEWLIDEKRYALFSPKIIYGSSFLMENM